MLYVMVTPNLFIATLAHSYLAYLALDRDYGAQVELYKTCEAAES